MGNLVKGSTVYVAMLNLESAVEHVQDAQKPE